MHVIGITGFTVLIQYTQNILTNIHTTMEDLDLHSDELFESQFLGDRL